MPDWMNKGILTKLKSRNKVYKRWKQAQITEGIQRNCLEHAGTGLESQSPPRVESGKAGEKQEERLLHAYQQQEEHYAVKNVG